MKRILYQWATKLSGDYSRFGILVIDTLFTIFSFVVACLLIFEFNLESHRSACLQGLLILVGLRLVSGAYFKSYSLIIRFIGEKDLRHLFVSIFTASLAFLTLVYIWPDLFPEKRFKAIIFVEFLITLILTGGARVGFRIVHDLILRSNNTEQQQPLTSVAIYGAGELGAMVERVIRNGADNPYRVLAFFDDDIHLQGKRLNCIPIYSLDYLDDMKKQSLMPQKVILGINQLDENKRVAFIERCLEKGIQVLKLPPTKEWINENIQVSDLREINFEDLLSRPPIELDLDQIESAYRGKTILVTGCAGTIGSEIVRQLIHHKPTCILGLDQAETPIADLRLEINGQHCFNPIIGSVRDINGVEAVFLKYKPDVVFHAAAYKHVPEMEAFPQEAVKTNICGTKVLADLAVKHKVERFVLISTDKAVNPTSVMGATKRVAELYVQALSDLPGHNTHFITTRFGNVLGSNGSVVPIFMRNIAQRKPITVTHEDITRYFMTTREACQLVLQAGSAGQGGEIFVFDMGKPVRIQDMARKLIQMAGLVPDVDIPILYSGLRPGEKMHEELFTEAENLKPTFHSKIMLAQSTIVPYDTLNGVLATLDQLALQNADRKTILAFLRDLLPEYTPMEPVPTPYQNGIASSNGNGVHVEAGFVTEHAIDNL